MNFMYITDKKKMIINNNVSYFTEKPSNESCHRVYW